MKRALFFSTALLYAFYSNGQFLTSDELLKLRRKGLATTKRLLGEKGWKRESVKGSRVFWFATEQWVPETSDSVNRRTLTLTYYRSWLLPDLVLYKRPRVRTNDLIPTGMPAVKALEELWSTTGKLRSGGCVSHTVYAIKHSLTRFEVTVLPPTDTEGFYITYRPALLPPFVQEMMIRKQ